MPHLWSQLSGSGKDTNRVSMCGHPPPVAALVALKQLAKSRQKRPRHVTHVFICQRLLWQEEWQRRFEKEMDIWFIFHTGTYWPHHLFEPLLVGISIPMKNRKQLGPDGPWLVRQQQEEVVPPLW